MGKQIVTGAGFVPLTAVISEMSADGSDIQVPVDSAMMKNIVDVNKDDDPMFITLEVLSEGVSKNNRNYTKEFIQDVVSQINERVVDGYQGHLTDAERATKNPDSQTIWLGAVAKVIDGKLRLFAKGYVMPYAKNLRQYLKTAKAVGKKVSVSINGLADKAIRNVNGSFDLTAFKLESIDWARPGAEGVPTSGRFILASEMHNDIISEEEENMTLEDALKQATADDIRTNCPALVTEMVANAVTEKETELTAQSQTIVTEMATVRQTLGLAEDANVAEAVTEMVKTNRDQELDQQLTAKVKNPEARKVIREMVSPRIGVGVNVSEMVDEVLLSDEAKTIVREMAATVPKIQPQVDRAGATQRKYSTVK